MSDAARLKYDDRDSNDDDYDVDYIKNIHNNDLFYLYDSMYILDYLIYIMDINNFSFDISFILNGHEHNINISKSLILEFKTVLSVRIDFIIKNKFNKLIHEKFYTIEKINELKTNISNEFNSITRENNQKLLEPKYDIKANYTALNDKKEIIRLLAPEERLRNIQPNDIQIIERTSKAITTNIDPFSLPNLNDLDKDRSVHYITYNNIIRQDIYNSQIITDFDLIRCKFNIMIDKNFFRKVEYDNRGNMRDIELTSPFSIPSEFIDVSIVRYYDNAIKHFFEEIYKSRNVPHSIYYNFDEVPKIENHIDIKIYSYNPTQVTEDLFYVLTTKNYLEPWIDKKYKKRIIRGIVLLNMLIQIYNRRQVIDVLPRDVIGVYDNRIWGVLPNLNHNILPNLNEIYVTFFTYVMSVYLKLEEISKEYDKLKTLLNADIRDQNQIRICRARIQNMKNQIIMTNDSIFVKFMDNYNPNNNADLIIKYNYIRSVRKQLVSMLTYSSSFPLINIDKKYSVVGDLVKIIFFWSELYLIQNDLLLAQIINRIAIEYQFLPIYIDGDMNNTKYVKNTDIINSKINFINFIRIIYDYGFKMLHVIYHPTINNNVIQKILNYQIELQDGGGNKYYKKYLKYKQKYLNKN